LFSKQTNSINSVSGINAWIIHCHFDLERPIVQAPESLGQFGGVGDGRTFFVDPTRFLEAGGLDHQRVAFPMSNRITVPPGIGVVIRKRPPVHEDLPDAVVGFVENYNQPGLLNDLARLPMAVELNRVERQTVRVRMVLAMRRQTLLA